MSLRTLKRRSDLIGNLSKYGFSKGSKRYAYAIYNERIASKHNIYKNVNIPTASEHLEEMKLRALDPSYNEHLLEGINEATMGEEFKKDDDAKITIPSTVSIGSDSISQIPTAKIEDAGWPYADHGVRAVEIGDKIYLLDIGGQKMQIYDPTLDTWAEVDITSNYFNWAEVPPKPIHRWKLTDIYEENAPDSMGGLSGVLNGDAQATSDGVLFDGNGDYISVFEGGTSLLPFRTFTAWVWFNSIAGGAQTLFDAVQWGSNAVRIIKANWGGQLRLQLSIKDVGGTDKMWHSNDQTTAFFQTWGHLAYTFGEDASGNIKYSLYVNGELAEENTDSNNTLPDIDASYNSILIGKIQWDNTTRFFNGRMKDIRIYDTPLDATAIKGIYSKETIPVSNVTAINISATISGVDMSGCMFEITDDSNSFKINVLPGNTIEYVFSNGTTSLSENTSDFFISNVSQKFEFHIDSSNNVEYRTYSNDASFNSYTIQTGWQSLGIHFFDHFDLRIGTDSSGNYFNGYIEDVTLAIFDENGIQHSPINTSFIAPLSFADKIYFIGENNYRPWDDGYTISNNAPKIHSYHDHTHVIAEDISFNGVPKRKGHSMVGHGDEIYLIGGELEHNICVFDISNNAIDYISDSSFNSTEFNTSSIDGNGEKIYIFGGYQNYNVWSKNPKGIFLAYSHNLKKAINNYHGYNNNWPRFMIDGSEIKDIGNEFKKKYTRLKEDVVFLQIFSMLKTFIGRLIQTGISAFDLDWERLISEEKKEIVQGVLQELNNLNSYIINIGGKNVQDKLVLLLDIYIIVVEECKIAMKTLEDETIFVRHWLYVEHAASNLNILLNSAKTFIKTSPPNLEKIIYILGRPNDLFSGQDTLTNLGTNEDEIDGIFGEIYPYQITLLQEIWDTPWELQKTTVESLEARKYVCLETMINPKYNLEENLSYYWKFTNMDGTFAPNTGVSNTSLGAIITGPAIQHISATKQNEEGIILDGLVVIKFGQITLDDGGFTFCTWIKHESPGVLLQFDNMTLSIGDGRTLHVENNIDDVSFNTFFDLSEVWHHIAVTISDSSCNAYRNGSKFEEVSFNGYSGLSGDASGGVGFEGALRDMRIYNKILDASGIHNIYKNATSSGQPIHPYLEHQWEMAEISGNKIWNEITREWDVSMNTEPINQNIFLDNIKTLEGLDISGSYFFNNKIIEFPLYWGGGMSFSSWIKFPTDISGNPLIMSLYPLDPSDVIDHSGQHVYLKLDDLGTIVLHVATSLVEWDSSGGKITPNEWNHIAFTIDSVGRICHYMNGVKKSELMYVKLDIGNNKYSLGFVNAPCKIRDVRLYSRALGKQEIYINYQNPIISRPVYNEEHFLENFKWNNFSTFKEVEKDIEIIDYFDSKTLIDVYKYSTDPFLSFNKKTSVTAKLFWNITDISANTIPSSLESMELESSGNILDNTIYTKFDFGEKEEDWGGIQLNSEHLTLTSEINTYKSFFLSFWIRFNTMPSYESFKMVDLKNHNLTIDGDVANYAELSHSNLGGSNKCIFSAYSYCFFDDKLMDGLVYYWPMDEGSGRTIKDIASSKNATHLRNIVGIERKSNDYIEFSSTDATTGFLSIDELTPFQQFKNGFSFSSSILFDGSGNSEAFFGGGSDYISYLEDSNQNMLFSFGRNSDNKLKICLSNNTTETGIDSSGAVFKDGWGQYVFTIGQGSPSVQKVFYFGGVALRDEETGFYISSAFRSSAGKETISINPSGSLFIGKDVTIDLIDCSNGWLSFYDISGGGDIFDISDISSFVPINKDSDKKWLFNDQVRSIYDGDVISDQGLVYHFPLGDPSYNEFWSVTYYNDVGENNLILVHKNPGTNTSEGALLDSSGSFLHLFPIYEPSNDYSSDMPVDISNVSLENFTFATWIKITNSSGSNWWSASDEKMDIISFTEGAEKKLKFQLDPDGTIKILYKAGTMVEDISATLHNYSPNIGAEWTHLAFTIETKEIHMYVNGQQENDSLDNLYALFEPFTPSSVFIGQLGTASERIIRDIRLYNKILSENEINNIIKWGTSYKDLKENVSWEPVEAPQILRSPVFKLNENIIEIIINGSAPLESNSYTSNNTYDHIPNFKQDYEDWWRYDKVHIYRDGGLLETMTIDNSGCFPYKSDSTRLSFSRWSHGITDHKGGRNNLSNRSVQLGGGAWASAGFDRNLNGGMKEVRIYNKALDASSVQILYDNLYNDVSGVNLLKYKLSINVFDNLNISGEWQNIAMNIDSNGDLQLYTNGLLDDGVIDEEITVYSDISNDFKTVETNSDDKYESTEALRNAYPNYFIFNSIFLKKWKLTMPSIYNDNELDISGSSLFISAPDIEVNDINTGSSHNIQQNQIKDLIFQDPRAVRVLKMASSGGMLFSATQLRKNEEGWSFSTWIRFGEYNDLNNIITLRDTSGAFVKLLGVSNMLGRNSSNTAVLFIQNNSGFYSFYLDDFFDIHGNWQMICIVIQWNGTISLYNNGELKGSKKIGNLPVGNLKVIVSGEDIIKLENDLGWKLLLNEFSSNILTNKIHCGEWDIVNEDINIKKSTETIIPLLEELRFDVTLMKWPPTPIDMVQNQGFVFSAWIKDLSNTIDITTNGNLNWTIEKDNYDAVFKKDGTRLSIGYDFFREEGIWKHVGVIVDTTTNREPTMILNGNSALGNSEIGISDYHIPIHDPSGMHILNKNGWRTPYHWWKLTDISGDDIPNSGSSGNNAKMIYKPSNNESGILFEDSTYLDIGTDLSFNSLSISVDISFNSFPAPILYLSNDNNLLDIFLDDTRKLNVKLKKNDTVVSEVIDISTNIIIRLSVVINENLTVYVRSIRDQTNNKEEYYTDSWGTIQDIIFKRCYIGRNEMHFFNGLMRNIALYDTSYNPEPVPLYNWSFLTDKRTVQNNGYSVSNTFFADVSGSNISFVNGISGEEFVTLPTISFPYASNNQGFSISTFVRLTKDVGHSNWLFPIFNISDASELNYIKLDIARSENTNTETFLVRVVRGGVGYTDSVDVSDEVGYGDSVDVSGGQWKHFVITVNNSNVWKVYIDTTISDIYINTGGGWELKDYTFNSVNCQNGKQIMNLSLYDYDLSVEDIIEIYNSFDISGNANDDDLTYFNKRATVPKYFWPAFNTIYKEVEETIGQKHATIVYSEADEQGTFYFNENYVDSTFNINLIQKDVFSICFWVNFKEFTNAELVRFQDEIVGGDINIKSSMIYNDSSNALVWDASNGDIVVDDFFNSGINSWYHIAITYSKGGVMDFYRNGWNLLSQTFNSEIDKNMNYRVFIGQPEFNGNIYDLRIYSAYLVQQDIENIVMSNVLYNFFAPNMLLKETATHHWKLTDITNDVAPNSGNSSTSGIVANYSTNNFDNGLKFDANCSNMIVDGGEMSYDPSWNYDFSVTFWIKMVTNTESRIIDFQYSKHGNYARGYIYFYHGMFDSILSLYVHVPGMKFDNGLRKLIKISTTIDNIYTNNTWYHFAVLFSFKNVESSAFFYVNGKELGSTTSTIGVEEYSNISYIHFGPLSGITMRDVHIYDYRISETHISSVIFDILEETHIITPSPMYNLNLKDSSNNTGFKHMEFSANEFHDISGHFFDGSIIDFSYGGYLDSIPVEYNGLSITMWVLKIGPMGDDLLYLDSSFNNITMEDGDIDGVKIGIYNSKLTISYYGQILKDTTLSIDTDVWFHIGLTVDSSGNGIFYFNGEKRDEKTWNSLNEADARWRGKGKYWKKAQLGKAFTGYIRDMRIYNKNISHDEIMQIMDFSSYKDQAIISHKSILKNIPLYIQQQLSFSLEIKDDSDISQKTILDISNEDIGFLIKKDASDIIFEYGDTTFIASDFFQDSSFNDLAIILDISNSELSLYKNSVIIKNKRIGLGDIPPGLKFFDGFIGGAQLRNFKIFENAISKERIAYENFLERENIEKVNDLSWNEIKNSFTNTTSVSTSSSFISDISYNFWTSTITDGSNIPIGIVQNMMSNNSPVGYKILNSSFKGGSGITFFATIKLNELPPITGFVGETLDPLKCKVLLTLKQDDFKIFGDEKIGGIVVVVDAVGKIWFLNNEEESYTFNRYESANSVFELDNEIHFSFTLGSSLQEPLICYIDGNSIELIKKGDIVEFSSAMNYSSATLGNWGTHGKEGSFAASGVFSNVRMFNKILNSSEIKKTIWSSYPSSEGGLAFDGLANNYLQLGRGKNNVDLTGSIFDISSCTFSTWVKYDSSGVLFHMTPIGYTGSYTQIPDVSLNYVSLELNDDHIEYKWKRYFYGVDSSGSITVNTIMDSSWCHVGFSIEKTNSGENIKIYKNGELIKVGTSSEGRNFYNQDITVGGKFTTSNNSLNNSKDNNWKEDTRSRDELTTTNFKGKVKNIILINRAVSQEEMIHLMFSGKDNSSAFHGELRNMKIYDRAIDMNEINKNIYEPYLMNHWKLTDDDGEKAYNSILNTFDVSLNNVVFDGSECLFDGSGDFIDLGKNILFKSDFEPDMLDIPKKSKNGFTFAVWMRYTSFSHKKDYYQRILDALEEIRKQAEIESALASDNLIKTTEDLNHKKNIARLASNMKTSPMNIEMLKNLPALRRRVKGRCVFNDEVRDAVRKGMALTNYEVRQLQEIVTIVQEEKSTIDISYNLAAADVSSALVDVFDFSNTSSYFLHIADVSQNNKISISNYNTTTDVVFEITNANVSKSLHVVDFFGNENEWQHVVFTADENGLMKVYKNGLMIASKTGIAPNTNVEYEGFLGKDINEAAVTFYGSLRDVRLYRRALSPLALQSIYWDEFSKSYIYPGLSADFRTYTPMLDPSSQLLLDTNVSQTVTIENMDDANWFIQTSPHLTKDISLISGLTIGSWIIGQEVLQANAKGIVRVDVLDSSAVEVNVQEGVFDISGVVSIGGMERGIPTKVINRNTYEDLQYRVFFQDPSDNITAMDASCNEGSSITFICGGEGGDFTIQHNENLRIASDALQIYDISSNTFTILKNPEILPRIWATSVYMKPEKHKGHDWILLKYGQRVAQFEKIFIFGGSVPKYNISGSHNRTKDVQIYDILNNTWKVESNRLDYAIAGATAIVVDNDIYIIGGDVSGRAVQIYRPEIVEINCKKGRIWDDSLEECIWDPNMCIFCPELCDDKNIKDSAKMLAEKCKSKCTTFHSDVKIENNRIDKLKMRHTCYAFGGFLFGNEATRNSYKEKIKPLPTTDVIGGWNIGDILIEVVDVSKFYKGNIIEIDGVRRIIVEVYSTVFEGDNKYYIQINKPL